MIEVRVAIGSDSAPDRHTDRDHRSSVDDGDRREREIARDRTAVANEGARHRAEPA